MQLDEAESRFKRASKTRFDYRPIELAKVTVVTDLAEAEGEALLADVKRFLNPVDRPELEWQLIPGGAYESTKDLEAKIEAEPRPELLVAYRSLKEPEKDPLYSLGTYLDVLTQVAPVPVLVLPSQEGGAPLVATEAPLKEVMVVTDHLAGDHRLVNYGLAFLREGGKLYLTHIEDDHVFERYMAAIAKIDEIDTETARTRLREQLLKEPRDFIASVGPALAKAGVSSVSVESIVRLGHRVRDYAALVEEHQVDLLVFNTKDESQLAMHGIAYSLAVELNRVPLLLL